MINSLTRTILEFLIHQEVVSKNNSQENDFIKYGVEITISSILNIVLILTIGLLLKSFYESIIFLICFITLRTYIGGFHANSYFNCNLTFCIAFVCVLFLYYFTRQYMSFIPATILCLFCILIISIFGPIENKNKPITEKKKHKLKLIGTLLSITTVLIDGSPEQHGEFNSAKGATSLSKKHDWLSGCYAAYGTHGVIGISAYAVYTYTQLG